MNLLSEVIEIIANVLEVPASEINEETVIGDIASWDSLHQMMIIDALEQHFSIHIEPEVILAMEDVRDIVSAIEE